MIFNSGGTACIALGNLNLNGVEADLYSDNTAQGGLQIFTPLNNGTANGTSSLTTFGPGIVELGANSTLAGFKALPRGCWRPASGQCPGRGRRQRVGQRHDGHFGAALELVSNETVGNWP